MDVTLRPLQRSDIAAWADLLAAVEEVDRTGEHYAAADLAEEMDNPDVEVGKDFVGAFDPDGRLVGYYSILPRGAADGRVYRRVGFTVESRWTSYSATLD